MDIKLSMIGLFILLAGYIIGLGAVTVIDIHGFLGRKSSYWTEATIKTHKVTKPMIWVGIILTIIGGLVFYQNENFVQVLVYQLIIAFVLIINGLFLSLYVSPFLIRQEKEGRSQELLPQSLQRKIVFSFIISDLGWWGSLALLVYYLMKI